MKVIDTSAIAAVLFDEPDAATIEEHMLTDRCVMSAATLVELRIVIESRRGPAGAQLLEELIARVGIEIVPVDEATANEARPRRPHRHGAGRGL